ALVSYVLPELHDYCSMFLALIAIVRVIHGKEFPSGIERFLRVAADPLRPERLRRLKDPAKGELGTHLEAWQYNLRAVATLFDAGEIQEAHSGWFRLLNRAFTSQGAALDE
ncbi:hypothetical protein FOZ63_024368, partial [Perkinsus olseni]